jgi:hypothetical protein
MTKSQVKDLVFIGILDLLGSIGMYWYVLVVFGFNNVKMW